MFALTRLLLRPNLPPLVPLRVAFVALRIYLFFVISFFVV